MKMLFTVQVIGYMLLIGAIIFFGFDTYLAFDKIPGNTWSEVIRHWMKSSLPILAWVGGVLLGHLAHPDLECLPLIQQPGGFIFTIWLTALMIFLGHAGLPFWVLAILGQLAGALFWPV